MTEKCPVCGKSGLPDYKTIPSACPQCNSDLKGYYLLYQAQTTIQKKNRIHFGVVAILVICFSICLPFLFLAAYHIANQKAAISGLAGDTGQISLRNSELSPARVNPDGTIQIRYVVRKGDNLSPIARFFYGDWRPYRQIMMDNNLFDEFKLMPNDTLLIKVRAEWKF